MSFYSNALYNGFIYNAWASSLDFLWIFIGNYDWWIQISKRLALLEFDSIRKSMVVIVRETSGQNRLLVKVVTCIVIIYNFNVSLILQSYRLNSVYPTCDMLQSFNFRKIHPNNCPFQLIYLIFLFFVINITLGLSSLFFVYFVIHFLLVNH